MYIIKTVSSITSMIETVFYSYPSRTQIALLIKAQFMSRALYNCTMDTSSEETLARIIRETRIAALGTLHDGEPNLAMVAYCFAEDFSAFYIHVSKLGKHTRDMESDPRISLLIAERDDQRADPQTLARLALQATAEVLLRDASDYALIKSNYLKRFPEAEPLFSLGDFNLWKLTPKSGRYVAGFARAFNIVPEAMKKVATL